MPATGPSSTTEGPVTRTLSRLRLFVARIIRLALPTRARPEEVRTQRPRSSNADYHLSMVQMRQVAECAGTFRDRLLIQALAETGLRRSEVAALAIQDLRLKDELLVVRHGKGGKSRLVPMTPELAAKIHHLCASRASGPVFKSSDDRQLSLRQVNRIVARAGKRAGVDHPNPLQRQLNCHLFRHSFARLWKAEGGSIETLSRIMGHSSVKTTWDLYGREGLQDFRDNYKKIMSEGLTKSPRGGRSGRDRKNPSEVNDA